jgi:hypothetical protein
MSLRGQKMAFAIAQLGVPEVPLWGRGYPPAWSWFSTCLDSHDEAKREFQTSVPLRTRRLRDPDGDRPDDGRGVGSGTAWLSHLTGIVGQGAATAAQSSETGCFGFQRCRGSPSVIAGCRDSGAVNFPRTFRTRSMAARSSLSSGHVLHNAHSPTRGSSHRTHHGHGYRPLVARRGGCVRRALC